MDVHRETTRNALLEELRVPAEEGAAKRLSAAIADDNHADSGFNDAAGLGAPPAVLRWDVHCVKQSAVRGAESPHLDALLLEHAVLRCIRSPHALQRGERAAARPDATKAAVDAHCVDAELSAARPAQQRAEELRWQNQRERGERVQRVARDPHQRSGERDVSASRQRRVTAACCRQQAGTRRAE